MGKSCYLTVFDSQIGWQGSGKMEWMITSVFHHSNCTFSGWYWVVKMGKPFCPSMLDTKGRFARSTFVAKTVSKATADIVVVVEAGGCNPGLVVVHGQNHYHLYESAQVYYTTL
jgi:hypothetical protein